MADVYVFRIVYTTPEQLFSGHKRNITPKSVFLDDKNDVIKYKDGRDNFAEHEIRRKAIEQARFKEMREIKNFGKTKL